MKKLNIIALLITACCITSSCNKDFLDRESKTTIAEEKIFNDPALIQLFVNNMYADVPSFDHDLYDNITDESRNFWGGAPRNVVQGQWFADNNPMDYWAYAAVRKTNMFLAKVDDSVLEGEEKSSLTGQVKFLRAKLYFDMVKRYGGVPIITEPQGLDDDLFVKRSTTDESFAFIIKEMEEAIDLLPETYGDRSVDVGKINKHAAKAFLGRVWLFWASPLYNPGNKTERWEAAAAINKEVIESNVYRLHDNFRRIMLDKNNEEEIFSVQFLKTLREHGWDSWAMPDSRSRQDASRRSPVQEFVDAFEMKNGKSIDDPASGYNAADPYINRDPRFDATLIVNGSVFGFQGMPVYTYIGGEDGINIPYQTVTGYLMRKGTDETNQDYYGGSGSDQNWIELRFAEVLLNYAEAKNESLTAPDPGVYEAVEKIRERAGLSPYQLPAGLTKEQMRDKIRHERYIELSFEQKRYWDLRRWKTAVSVLNGKQFGAMYITKHDNGSYTYEVKPVDGVPCVFQEKMYFMPIPQRELEKNPNLEQNNDW
ncbi:RagB/SusD family nutrient uptake outer membrane protein [Agriterribacter sp.]|uniref:RagB/SusD family nutrient uptake outer membrane protein n=1 Tax=Agriterribacter sp. TaxID=2821509 RepID=UPI002C57A366|nr:RagB/SusD family nutrient uptake outer membrane protein [Agriterribacter sp.]HTN05890.1 RagB/SusD family nutrient uptake outer membrane protein [Agriterribacter sp.]